MKRLIAILFIFISAMSLDAQTQKSLPVNRVDQVDRSKWCWAASITSIAQYYGKPVATIRDVLETARNINPARFGTADCHYEPCLDCHQDNVMVGVSGSATISEVLTQLGLPNMAAGGYYPANYALRAPLTSIDQVKWNINQGRPILATWQNKNNSGGHAVVINGYYGTDITYMNPLDVNSYESEVFDNFVESTSKYWYGTAVLTTDPPSNPCSSNDPRSITGPSIACTSNSTYTLNNACAGSTISWSVSSGRLQKVYSSGNTAVFRGLAGMAGTDIIQATETTSYGQVLNATPLTVWVGTPIVSYISGPSSGSVGSSSSYTVTYGGANVTSFNWALLPSVYSNYFNPNGNYCYITWYTAGTYGLSANAVNTCGASSNCWYPITINKSSYSSSLAISPNPASDNVQVSVMKAQDISITPDSTSITTSKFVTSANQDLVSTYTVRIYNSFGILSYSTKKSGNEFTIPVNNLNDGTYIIEANDGKKSYKQQLIVKH